MGKYEPLAEQLNARTNNQWTATFAEIEQILGFPLPPSARKYREWWSNQRGGGHSQARGWQSAGWQVWKVDLGKQEVVFRRPGPIRTGDRLREADDEALFEQASGYLGISDRMELIREALRALIAREAGARLIRLGGTMPDLKVPARERPVT